MSSAPLATAASDRLLQLIERIEALPDFAEVVDSLQAGHAATLDGVWGSSCALVATALAREAPAVLVIVCPRLDEVQGLIGDLSLFSSLEPWRFPVHQSLSAQRMVQDDAVGDRVRVLKALLGAQPPKVVVTSIPALLQPVPSRTRLAEQTRTLRIGEPLSVDDISSWLVRSGFQNTTAVELPGEFSHRGGIIDIFAPDWFNPVRIELFGDEIESIRQFEVASQRSLERVKEVEITAVVGVEKAEPSPPSCSRSETGDWRVHSGNRKRWAGQPFNPHLAPGGRGGKCASRRLPSPAKLVPADRAGRTGKRRPSIPRTYRTAAGIS